MAKGGDRNSRVIETGKGEKKKQNRKSWGEKGKRRVQLPLGPEKVCGRKERKRDGEICATKRES